MTEDAFIAAMRAALEARRAELSRHSEATAADRAPVELDQSRVGRLSRMDALQGQEMAKAQDARRGQELQRTLAALARIDSGTYGDCLRCGDEIAAKRLRADPATPLCIDCASGAR